MNEKESPLAGVSQPRTLQQLVIGVGGAGGNIAAHLAVAGLSGTPVYAVNTDAQALATLTVDRWVVLGEKSMRGLGAGGDPERGRQAAEDSQEQLCELLHGCDLVYLVAGMGGGTGTGAAPVVARLAREAGAMVLAVVTLPFEFEGTRRRQLAESGVLELRAAADGVIVVPNEKIFPLLPEHSPLPQCFALIHDYLYQGVRSVSRLIAEPGMINVDFADLGAVLRGSNGTSALAHVEASGMNLAEDILERLQQHPLLDEGQVLGAARSLLVSLNCGPDTGMSEISRVMAGLQAKAPGALINLGVAVQPDMAGRLGVTVVAGLDGGELEAAGAAPMEPAPRARRRPRAEAKDAPEMDTEFVANPNKVEPCRQRFVAPAPNLTSKQAADLMLSGSGRGLRGRRNARQAVQGTLPFDIVAKGRFEKSEPTLHHGENLDEPTYIRRGVVLN